MTASNEGVPDSHKPTGTRSFACPALCFGRTTYPSGGSSLVAALPSTCARFCNACNKAAMPPHPWPAGQPSNHRKEAKLRRRVLQLYRKDYHDFGPTFRPRNWPNAAWRCLPTPCVAGCSPKTSGSPSDDGTSTAAVGHDAPASASWCRWIPPSTTGPKAAGRTWF